MNDKLKNEKVIDVIIEIRDLLKYQVKLFESLVENRKPSKSLNIESVMDNVKDMLSAGGSSDKTAKIFENIINKSMTQNKEEVDR